MSVGVSLFGLFLALFLLIFLAYKGHSVIIIAPIVAAIAALFAEGMGAHLMARYTESYMSAFANYAKSYFPLYLLGAVFAKLMEVSGNADTIAKFVADKLGKDKAILAVVLACAILTYGGVSLFVVAFGVLPIAIMLFRQADIPKRLIPGTIALGAFTFTMTCLPGTPQVQNTIPMSYLGTDSFAAPVLGIIAGMIIFFLGMLWLNRRAKQARDAGEGYGNHQDRPDKMGADAKLPGIAMALLPVVVIITVNLICSKIIYPSVNGAYLEGFNTTLSKVAGNWSVLIGLIVSILLMVALNVKKLGHIKQNLKDAASNSFAPLINSCAVVGFGGVIKTLTIFGVIQAFVLGLSSNPLISEILSINLLCGLTASSSGGLATTLEVLGATYVEMGARVGIGPEVIHRIASVASGGLDTLPHNGATITTLALCGMTHKDSYKDMFATSVVIPIIATIVIVILASLGVRF